MNRTEIKDEADAAANMGGGIVSREARAAIIARDNDQFRKACAGGDPAMAGRVVHSAGIHELGFGLTAQAYLAVRDFTAFNEDNDPHGEHDFGAFDLGNEKLFWKIDYYSDETCTWGSEDPTDPDQVFRVLTIYLASEH